MKLLPIGIQNLEKIIKNNYIYIDKTKYLYDLIQTGSYYFISRPRRFGKSLTCSTFAEIFSGNKELFKNCLIYNSDYNWQKYPVIEFNFNSIAHNSKSQLILGLNEKLNDIAKKQKIDLSDYQTLESKFYNLIEKTSINHKSKVVVIIYEYDKAIVDNISNIEEAEEIKNVLSNFYGVIKDLDQYLKFFFLTGVSKFSKTSIFSKLNNLEDLTISKNSSTLMGYTKKEIEIYFDKYIEKIRIEQNISKEVFLESIKNWYNGYCFYPKAEKVYNPFSILNYLKQENFQNFWFESGTPTFLINLIKEKDYPIPEIENALVNHTDLNSFDVNNIKLLTLLFQTGYLTIKEYNPETRICESLRLKSRSF